MFKSWSNPRAVTYRKINKTPADVIGTAVNVQTMVFGNMGADSGTGVLFTRNPSTGEDVLYGEFLQVREGGSSGKLLWHRRTLIWIVRLLRYKKNNLASCLLASSHLPHHFILPLALQDAQGEDVVAGIRTPKPIAQLKELNPAVYEELYATVKGLEERMGDMQVRLAKEWWSVCWY